MAKKRKMISKSKSGKKRSAKAAKRKRAASKRADSKRAKTKVAKRKVPERRTGDDPCQREREARDRVLEEIRSIEDALSDADIPDDIRKRLEERRRQKQGRLRFLQQKLDECEAKHS
jgi:hypothetical protein